LINQKYLTATGWPYFNFTQALANWRSKCFENRKAEKKIESGFSFRERIDCATLRLSSQRSALKMKRVQKENWKRAYFSRED